VQHVVVASRGANTCTVTAVSCGSQDSQGIIVILCTHGNCEKYGIFRPVATPTTTATALAVGGIILPAMNHNSHREFVQQRPILLEEQLAGISLCLGDWQRLQTWGHVGLLHVVQGTSGPPPHTPHLIMSTSRLIMLNSHTDPHCSPCIAEPSLVSAVASVFASIMDSLTEHASSSGLFVGKAVSSTSLHCKCPGSR